MIKYNVFGLGIFTSFEISFIVTVFYKREAILIMVFRRSHIIRCVRRPFNSLQDVYHETIFIGIVYEQ